MFAPLRVWSWFLVIALLLLSAPSIHAQAANFEVWIVDQSDAAQGGAKLHIFPGSALSGSQFTGQMEIVDLEAGSQGVGAGPGVRPHLLLFNSNHSHAVLAYVASGHVQVIRAADRRIVASIDVGEQAHGAVPSPDGSIILAANQNGKKLARIRSDFAREQFSHNPDDDLDLKALEGADQPDNAPICPLLFTGANKAYVTLRGGGLYVVDTASTPMKVLKSFTKDQVAPAGCGGVAVGNKIFVNSGNATSGSLYVFDAASDTLVKSIPTTSHGTDAHGMVLVGNNRFLWMANRGEGDNVVVVDTSSESVVGTFAGIGAAPDLMDPSPAGDRVFVSLRGPNNLTGGPPAKGETPGLAVLTVGDGGRSGSRAFFVPIGDQSSTSAVDPHAIAVRRTAAPAAPSPAAPAPAAPAAAPAPAAPAAQPAAPPAQVPRALPRTGEAVGHVDAALAVGIAALLAGLALRRRRVGT
jgi:DNA-binding beta-propeller fold protein YncE